MGFDFNKHHVEKVLAGNVKMLVAAFIWGETPEGWEYWSAIYNSSHLTDEARAILEELIRD